MSSQKVVVTLDSFEQHLMVNGLVEFKNGLKRQDKPLEDVEDLIMKVIDEFEGVLPFDDKVSPEIINREFGLSKNAFKRAVGHLLKEGKIALKDKRIYRT